MEPKRLDTENGYVDPQLEQMQRIELGGTMKRVEVDRLPLWLRLGYIVVIAGMLGMIIMGAYVSYFK